MKTFAKLLLVQFSLLQLGNIAYAQKKHSLQEITFIKWLFQNPETRPYITPYTKDSITVYSNRLSAERIDLIKKN